MRRRGSRGFSFFFLLLLPLIRPSASSIANQESLSAEWRFFFLFFRQRRPKPRRKKPRDEKAEPMASRNPPATPPLTIDRRPGGGGGGAGGGVRLCRRFVMRWTRFAASNQCTRRCIRFETFCFRYDVIVRFVTRHQRHRTCSFFCVSDFRVVVFFFGRGVDDDVGEIELFRVGSNSIVFIVIHCKRVHAR